MSRRNENTYRHTVPNASYSSFPCYQEELKLRTNVTQCDTIGETQNDHIGQQENFQLNVSMHDKLKMCFAEMETMKDQFECRRRRLAIKKRNQKETAADPTRTKQTTASRLVTRTSSQQQEQKSNNFNLLSEMVIRFIINFISDSGGVDILEKNRNILFVYFFLSKLVNHIFIEST